MPQPSGHGTLALSCTESAWNFAVCFSVNVFPQPFGQKTRCMRLACVSISQVHLARFLREKLRCVHQRVAMSPLRGNGRTRRRLRRGFRNVHQHIIQSAHRTLRKDLRSAAKLRIDPFRLSSDPKYSNALPSSTSTLARSLRSTRANCMAINNPNGLIRCGPIDLGLKISLYRS
jgi:hypothetical protein